MWFAPETRPLRAFNAVNSWHSNARSVALACQSIREKTDSRDQIVREHSPCLFSHEVQYETDRNSSLQ
jgi:hypothetical protein